MIPQDFLNVITWMKKLPMPLLIQLIDEASAELNQRIKKRRAPTDPPLQPDLHNSYKAEP